jgi:hypothetical protein
MYGLLALFDQKSTFYRDVSDGNNGRDGNDGSVCCDRNSGKQQW